MVVKEYLHNDDNYNHNNHIKIDNDNYSQMSDDKSQQSSSTFWRWRRPKLGIAFANATGINNSTYNNNHPESSNPSGSRSGTIADAVASLFGDIDVSDVILQGNDGGSVHAIKAILASRSTTFRTKFFGEQGRTQKDLVIPGEKQKQIVKFKHWDVRILHMIVEYCYTDSCSIMKAQPTDEIARIMSQLRVATRAFKLPGLLDKIQQWGWRNLNRYPALSCAMVDEGMKLDDIDELALKTLQLKPRAALLPEYTNIGAGVLSLTKPGLLFVLRTLEDATSHLLLLQVIERWVDFSSEDSVSDSPSRERATRLAFGRKCALRFIKASKINPANFDRAMEQSKLFQERKDLTSVTLLEGLQFSEKSYTVEAKREQGQKVAMARRPQTAIGIIRTNGSEEQSIQPTISQ